MARVIMVLLSLAAYSSAACTQDVSTRAKLVDHLCYLASDSLSGRVATSKGDSLARAYIANYFMKCGLHSILEDDSFFQSVPILTSIAIDSASAVTVFRGNRVARLKRGSEFVVNNESGCGGIDGEVAFIGYGIHEPKRGYDGYGELPLSGKIAMCYLYPPKQVDPDIKKMAFKESYLKKAERIRRLGGLAVVFVEPDGLWAKRASVDPRDGNPLPQRLRQQGIPIVRISENTMFHIMADAGVDIAVLKESLLEKPDCEPFCIPDTRVSMEIRLTYSYKATYNVMGFLEGEGSTETIVIGAHYDHVGPAHGVVRSGADDNASGVAVVLELARLCASQGHDGCNLLFVAFGAEELGNVGSRFFLSHVPDRIGRIKAMLNFDMVGRPTENVLYVHHVQSAEEWGTVLRDIPAGQFDIRSGPNWSATDSGPFYSAGIPVLWFYTGSHEGEVSGEEIDSIDFWGMEKIVRYSMDLAERIASDSVFLTFQKRAP